MDIFRLKYFANSGLGNDDALPEQILVGAVEAMRGGHFALMPELITFTAPFIAQKPCGSIRAA